ncbi:hypothetical protein SOVF_089740 [Spinacia oleracea]|nr:hypothetical protein SOVF_089740 [Spinacia oleracea]
MYLSNGELDTPIYLDFVTLVVVDNKIYVSIGPTINNENQADDISNGLEMMKLSDIDTLSLETSPPPWHSSSKNKTRPPPLQSSSTNEIGVIVGTIIGVIVLLVLASLFIVYKRRSIGVGEVNLGLLFRFYLMCVLSYRKHDHLCVFYPRQAIFICSHSSGHLRFS